MQREFTVSRRERRNTGRSPRVFDNTVASPCVQVCELDEDDICMGCFRSADEIRDWMVMTREQKLQTLESLAERKKRLW